MTSDHDHEHHAARPSADQLHIERTDSVQPIQKVTPHDRLRTAGGIISDVLSGERRPEDARRALIIAGLGCVPVRKDADDIGDLLIAATVERLQSASRDAVIDIRNRAGREIKKRDKQANLRRRAASNGYTNTLTKDTQQ